MSFTGDLEHLPIVDIVQLLHATRKSGTLTVRSRKGESQLVFKDGFIVSANHLNNSVRIGQVLIKMDALTPDQLQKTLQEQKAAGDNRKPLIATLLENGTIDKEVAYKGLENLIEMTVVEILTWDGGTFDLSVDMVQVSDEYRYFPDKFQQEISLDTQSVLMDALRIYDEQKRDGQLDSAAFGKELPGITEQAPAPPPSPAPAGQPAVAPSAAQEEPAREKPNLSAADLGLDDLDKLEKVIPDVFQSIKDYQPEDEHLQRLTELLPDLPRTELQSLALFLHRFGKEPPPIAAPQSLETNSQALIFFSNDPVLTFALTTLCKNSGLHGFSTHNPDDLAPIVQQYLAKEIEPILVIDRFKGAVHDLVHTVKSKFPSLTTLQLGSNADFVISLPMFQYGIRAMLPKPDTTRAGDALVDDLIQFLSTFYAYIFQCFCQKNRQNMNKVNSFITGMRDLSDAPDVSLALLRQVAEFFPRAITFVVRKNELIAERGIGILHEGEFRKPTVLQFRVPLSTSTLLQEVVRTEQPFFDRCEDQGLQDELYPRIGAPLQPHLLLLPMKSNGRIITLTYADFGAGEPTPVQVDILAILAHQAGLIVENSFFRKQLGKQS